MPNEQNNDNMNKTVFERELEAYREALEASSPQRNQPATGPKLTFAERCAIFAAAKASTGRRRHGRGQNPRDMPDELKIKRYVLAKAFGISPMTVGQIVKCETGDRYPDVAREWRTLGEDAFMHKYFTPEVREKTLQAHRERTGPNPAAKSHSLEKYGPIPFWSELYLKERNLGVEWSADKGAWRVHVLDDETGEWDGVELDQSFPTSRKAFVAIKKIIDAGKLVA